jgi:ribosome modulation factor
MILSYFHEGKKAYANNVSPLDCPYPNKDSEAHKSWVAGWNHAWYAAHEPGFFQ